MIQFFQSIKYISSLEAFEYHALKRDSLKIKSSFLAVVTLIGRFSFLGIIYFLIKMNVLAIILCLVVGTVFSFLSYYLRMYRALQSQLGNPFYKNSTSKEGKNYESA